MAGYLEFLSGIQMPIIGLGTWLCNDTNELESALETALDAGYRHLDTAFIYQNEHCVGKVLKKYMDQGLVKRKDLFIVTKIGLRESDVRSFLYKSLANLQLGYVDLCLIHHPVGLNYTKDGQVFPFKDGKFDLNDTDHLNVWKEMEKLVDDGKVRAIGLSNFNERQIKQILLSCRIQPSNLQVEMHVYFQRKALREFCKEHNITLCAYAPLGSPGRKSLFDSVGLTFESNGLLQDPTITFLAKKYKKLPSHILLRFLVQQGIAVIPKSVHAKRIKSNFEIFDFEINEEDMEVITELDKGKEGCTFDHAVYPGINEHPEFFADANSFEDENAEDEKVEGKNAEDESAEDKNAEDETAENENAENGNSEEPYWKSALGELIYITEPQ